MRMKLRNICVAVLLFIAGCSESNEFVNGRSVITAKFILNDPFRTNGCVYKITCYQLNQLFSSSSRLTLSKDFGNVGDIVVMEDNHLVAKPPESH